MKITNANTFSISLFVPNKLFFYFLLFFAIKKQVIIMTIYYDVKFLYIKGKLSSFHLRDLISSTFGLKTQGFIFNTNLKHIT